MFEDQIDFIKDQMIAGNIVEASHEEEAARARKAAEDEKKEEREKIQVGKRDARGQNYPTSLAFLTPYLSLYMHDLRLSMLLIRPIEATNSMPNHNPPPPGHPPRPPHLPPPRAPAGGH